MLFDVFGVPVVLASLWLDPKMTQPQGTGSFSEISNQITVLPNIKQTFMFYWEASPDIPMSRFWDCL